MIFDNKDAYLFHTRQLRIAKQLKKVMSAEHTATLPTGEVVKRITPIKTGVEVILIGYDTYNPSSYEYDRYLYGSVLENVYTVLDSFTIFNRLEKSVDAFKIEITPENYITLTTPVLLAYADYLTFRETNPKLTDYAPFKDGDVVYLAPQPGKTASQSTPYVGSEFETDMKVINVTKSKFGSAIRYTVYIPKYGYRELRPTEKLITREERSKYLYKDYKNVTANIDMKPFFSKDEKLKIFDGWVYNESETTIVKLTPTLLSNLTDV
jgi:hypothetical protein